MGEHAAPMEDRAENSELTLELQVVQACWLETKAVKSLYPSKPCTTRYYSNARTSHQLSVHESLLQHRSSINLHSSLCLNQPLGASPCPKLTPLLSKYSLLMLIPCVLLHDHFHLHIIFHSPKRTQPKNPNK